MCPGTGRAQCVCGEGEREMMREQEQEVQAQALVDLLRGVLHPDHVWREDVNGRWLVFLREGEQTYCLLPLHYEPPVVA